MRILMKTIATIERMKGRAQVPMEHIKYVTAPRPSSRIRKVNGHRMVYITDDGIRSYT